MLWIPAPLGSWVLPGAFHKVFGYDLLETDEARSERDLLPWLIPWLLVFKLSPRGVLQADLTLSLRDSGKSMQLT